MEFKQKKHTLNVVESYKEKQKGNKIQKQNAKLQNYAIFSKSIEYQLKKVYVKTLTTRRQYLKWSIRLNLKEKNDFGFWYWANSIEKEMCKINHDKPIYIETGILNLNEVLVQDFHYNYIKNKHVDKAEMWLLDTDSLMYKIEAENIYEDFYKDKDLLNFSNYPKDWKNYNNSNKLVWGIMKDEASHVPIKGFGGLKSKMYFLSLKKIMNLKEQKTLMKMLFIMN